MKVPSNKDRLAESKILILYILKKLEKPVSHDSLLNLVLSGTDINYFYFKQYLDDLLSSKYVFSFEENDVQYYEITEEGIEAYELTKDMVPGIVKLKVDANFKSALESFENEHTIVAEYEQINESSYRVICKIVDHEDVIFETRVITWSKDEAKNISKNWKENAESLYPEIMKKLTK